MRQTLLALAAVGAAIGIARVALLVIKVDGSSMAPTFRAGDTVLTIRRAAAADRAARRRGRVPAPGRNARPG